MSPRPNLYQRVRNLLIGGARSPLDKSLYHKLSLVAFFAWVGLGADGLSSSCYGPPAAFLALKEYPYLGIFVALATAVTIFVISSSYSQIIELFPNGGGGYVVASKLLAPRLGMVAGCALLVDYVLTITVSVASGAEALFSFLPAAWYGADFADYRLAFAVCCVLGLTLLNLRGVRESVAPLVPIFLVFVLTHAFLIVSALAGHAADVGGVIDRTAADVRGATASLGAFGMLMLILHAYSMGAGTYTGIEAVSNGLPILREPRVQTGKRVMNYMWISLAVTVVGLMLSYLLLGVHREEGKTLNAVLLERLAAGWGTPGSAFVIVTLVSEAALLFVAAQTGLLGGPRVLANMAMDRWFPTRLSMLSDRLVTGNGVLIMSGAAVVTMLATGGRVEYLVVLYSINVFITFLLSQAGMVRHWWLVRGKAPHWRKKLFINGVGAVLTLFILVWVTLSKFHEGGWATLVVTTSLVVFVSLIHRHYTSIRPIVQRFDKLAESAASAAEQLKAAGGGSPAGAECDPNAKTAVLLVSGFNGFGMHALLNILKLFGDSFHNFVFVQVGLIDAGNFKGVDEVEHLQKHVSHEVERYVQFVRQHGYCADGFCSIGTDVADELEKVAPKIVRRFPQSVFFGGQVVFPSESRWTRWLHNNIAFAVQRRLYRQGIPFVVLPIRV